MAMRHSRTSNSARTTIQPSGSPASSNPPNRAVAKRRPTGEVAQNIGDNLVQPGNTVRAQYQAGNRCAKPNSIAAAKVVDAVPADRISEQAERRSQSAARQTPAKTPDCPAPTDPGPSPFASR